jgi:type I restriction enzyme M protein
VNDKTQRFKFLPSISDGQLLFMQHLISKLNANGVGVVVHNGSTLFSGDAGSAESNIRKWMLDSDIMEAVIQLPTDEFFNTGIYTYLWVLNKNKSPDQRDRVMLINASEKFKPLKKNKGSKRKEVDEASRSQIVETLTQFVDNDYARVFDKEFFYFNKQAIMLTNVDEQGRTFASCLKEGETSLKLKPLKLENGARSLTEFSIVDYGSFQSLEAAFEQDIKPFVEELKIDNGELKIEAEEWIAVDGKKKLSIVNYQFSIEQETLVKEVLGKREELGCGRIVVKAALKKATKTQPKRVEITVELTPDYQKDYEIIPFHRDGLANRAAIEAFMAKYITKPFEYLENVVGVEINFNKVFYQPEKLRSVEEILGEIAALDEELRSLEQGLSL